MDTGFTVYIGSGSYPNVRTCIHWPGDVLVGNSSGSDQVEMCVCVRVHVCMKVYVCVCMCVCDAD